MSRLKPLLLALALLLGAGSACAQSTAALRLGFLLNFSRFVEWPESALQPGAPLRICLAPGDAEMAAHLGDLARQTVPGHAIAVRPLQRPGEAAGCQVLYIPAETPGPAAPWLNAAQQGGALTVGDSPDFIEAGGMIGLVPVGGRYRFDINLGVARQTGLRLSSQLLKLAGTVK